MIFTCLLYKTTGCPECYGYLLYVLKIVSKSRNSCLFQEIKCFEQR